MYTEQLLNTSCLLKKSLLAFAILLLAIGCGEQSLANNTETEANNTEMISDVASSALSASIINKSFVSAKILFPPPISTAVAPPLDARGAGMYWRFIAIKSDPDVSCPNVSGLRVRPLFTTRDKAQEIDIPPGLRQYCLYEDPSVAHRLGARQLPPQLEELLKGGFFTSVSQDQAALATLGDPLDDIMIEPFSKAFDQQTGKMPFLPTITARVRPVRLALIDTTPTKEPTVAIENITGFSLHGYSLANMIKRLTCHKENCTTVMTSQLGTQLRYTNTGKLIEDEVNGGSFGSIAFLAEAIRHEVQRWDSIPEKNRPRLVINLSLGWLSLYGGNELTKEPAADVKNQIGLLAPDVRAVYSALVDARCRGAVVIAAAGNTSGGQTLTKGPILPAAWESVSVPDAHECEELLGGEHQGISERANIGRIPLVYAAGGIDTMGLDLAISRPQSRPRLVAYADHATVPVIKGATPIKPLTGTSVASAVIAATTSTVWYYQSGLAGYEIIETIYKAGDFIGIDAEFGLESPLLPAKRISVCQAATAACASGGGACPPVSTWPECGLWEKKPIALDALDFTAFNTTATSTTGTFNVSYTDPVCGSSKLYNYTTGKALNPCPDSQYYNASAQPWVDTQPGSTPCPNCLARRSFNLLNLSLDSSYTTMSSPSIEVVTAGTSTYYSLADFTGAATVNVLLPSGSLSTADSVTLNGLMGSQSITSALYIAE